MLGVVTTQSDEEQLVARRGDTSCEQSIIVAYLSAMRAEAQG